MPRAAIYTSKDLPSGVEVALSRELWDLVLSQLQPEFETTGGSSSSLNKSTNNTLQATNGRSRHGTEITPERVAVAITRRYKLGRGRSRSTYSSPITSLVCWACLDTFPAPAVEQQGDKGKGESKSKDSLVCTFNCSSICIIG